MVLAVVAEIVTAVIDFKNLIRVAVHPASGHEKCGFDIIFIKNVKNFYSIFIAPCGVK